MLIKTGERVFLAPFARIRFSANFRVVQWWTTSVVIYHGGNIYRGVRRVSPLTHASNRPRRSRLGNAIRSVSQIDACDHGHTCINLINAILTFVPPSTRAIFTRSRQSFVTPKHCWHNVIKILLPRMPINRIVNYKNRIVNYLSIQDQLNDAGGRGVDWIQFKWRVKSRGG